MVQTRRLIRSHRRATLPGHPSCYQLQAGACRFADGWMDKVSYCLSAIWAACFAKLHLHLVAQTAELRTRGELAV
jgi:hypothetical protein